MRQEVEHIIEALSKESRPYNWLIDKLSLIDELQGLELDEYMIELLGLAVRLNSKNEFELRAKHKKIKDEIFCVVDIESTASLKRGGQIIEIGAYKIQNSKEIDSFHSLIRADFVPSSIQELTGLDVSMLKNAPSLPYVLNEFRLFLKDNIFVAHNVFFDYNFISTSLYQCGFGILLNQKLCTIDLAKRLIDSEKYGLNALKDLLNIQNTHHRALDDAKAASEVLKYCISRLPFYISSTQDLINFSKSNIKKYAQRNKIV